MSALKFRYLDLFSDECFLFSHCTACPIGAIIGIVVGVVVLACVLSVLLPLLICCFLRVGVYAALGCACASKKNKKDEAELKGVEL